MTKHYCCLRRASNYLRGWNQSASHPVPMQLPPRERWSWSPDGDPTIPQRQGKVGIQIWWAKRSKRRRFLKTPPKPRICIQIICLLRSKRRRLLEKLSKDTDLHPWRGKLRSFCLCGWGSFLYRKGQICVSIFIGPRFNHCLLLSLTDNTDSLLTALESSMAWLWLMLCLILSLSFLQSNITFIIGHVKKV